MTNKSLSPSKIVKLQDVFGAALRKADPLDQEAQDLIENRWAELEPELMKGFTTAVDQVLDRMRNIVRLTIPCKHEISLPPKFKEIISDVSVEPATYTLTFEGLFNEGETLVKGEELVKRAVDSGAIAGLQHALWLLENQHLIPEENKAKELLFAGTVLLLTGKEGYIAASLSWKNGRWLKLWVALNCDYDRSWLIVRSKKM